MNNRFTLGFDDEPQKSILLEYLRDDLKIEQKTRYCS